MTEKNKIIISRSSTNKVVDPTTGKNTQAEQVQPDRSFAQQNPVVAPKKITPKVHASLDAEKEAILRASKVAKSPPPAPKEEDSE